ncbi:MAG TPA: hypothetical protein IAA61_06285 [Candidatus Ornithomonoglobus merdipullorum]|uniref:Uncharacterized protein n=1 Tax=Candidatus Ornithomonoglobus merdipullorum TaxID=2840895 RepID=A0A9D1MC04_9FIRM|nr:hypothetical protein [Candidatus Ornithomonoglobus merdipullorum]
MTGVEKLEESEKGFLYTSVLRAFIDYGTKTKSGLTGIRYVSVDEDNIEYTYKTVNNVGKKQDITISFSMNASSIEIGNQNVVNISVRYKGNLYTFTTDPEFSSAIFDDFKQGVTIAIIDNVGKKAVKEYLQLVGVTISELFFNIDEMTAQNMMDCLKNSYDIFKTYNTLRDMN